MIPIQSSYLRNETTIYISNGLIFFHENENVVAAKRLSKHLKANLHESPPTSRPRLGIRQNPVLVHHLYGDTEVSEVLGEDSNPDSNPANPSFQRFESIESKIIESCPPLSIRLMVQ